jgi:hypothetical protein
MLVGSKISSTAYLDTKISPDAPLPGHFHLFRDVNISRQVIACCPSVMVPGHGQHSIAAVLQSFS